MGTNSSLRSGCIEAKKVILVGTELLQEYRRLRLRGLIEHPEAFGETPEGFQGRSDDDLKSLIEAQAGLGGFILAAISPSKELIGTVGLARNAPGKSRHRSYLWGMYVAPEYRGRGVGQALMDELLGRAEAMQDLEQVHLSVVTSNQPAVRLYERMGFSVYGTDLRALKVGNEAFDEHLMVKVLSGRC